MGCDPLGTYIAKATPLQLTGRFEGYEWRGKSVTIVIIMVLKIVTHDFTVGAQITSNGE